MADEYMPANLPTLLLIFYHNNLFPHLKDASMFVKWKVFEIHLTFNFSGKMNIFIYQGWTSTCLGQSIF